MQKMHHNSLELLTFSLQGMIISSALQRHERFCGNVKLDLLEFREAEKECCQKMHHTGVELLTIGLKGMIVIHCTTETL